MIKDQKLLKVLIHLVHDGDMVSSQVLGVLELSNLLVAPLIVGQHEGFHDLVFSQGRNRLVPFLSRNRSVSSGRPVLEDAGVAWLLAVLVELASWPLEVGDAGGTLGCTLGVDVMIEGSSDVVQQSTRGDRAGKFPRGIQSRNSSQRFLIHHKLE